MMVLSCKLLILLKLPLFFSIFHGLASAAVNYTANSTYESNLDTLLSSLPSNATGSGFFNTNIGQNPDTVYGFVLCRGDATHNICRDCLNAATKDIKQLCPRSKSAAVWYDYCQLSYSDKLNSLNEGTRHVYMENATSNVSDPAQFRPVLSQLLTNVSSRAANRTSLGLFATEETGVGNEDVYGLAQCRRDLSTGDCGSCLQGAVGDVLKCCSFKKGARVLSANCSLRFEFNKFYTDSVPGPAPSPGPASPFPDRDPRPAPSFPKSEKRSGSKSPKTIIAIVIPIVAVVALLSLIVPCFVKRKLKKKSKDEDEISSMEALQFDLDTIKFATNNFSEEKKLGQGGFGAVYKGTLPNGQEAAVKRLSSASRQGMLEFRNEVQLVAKLQHRNLVRLLAFCAEGNEKILVYEYVPNTSLDHFLFDPSKKVFLTWEIRYKIIGGIVRGILYLHEDSRLRIIHRDLKASNILLDNDMNPKIADFGMARLFGADQTQGSTNVIAGTYGYMAPEYAMRGRFSVKSDVFSFGVLLLEIISGQKNNTSNQSDSTPDLLSHAWQLWTKGTPLELMDPTFVESYSRNEVMRCIHIGLLCVQEDAAERPTMSSVALMLNSFAVTLPTSIQPPYFLMRGQTEFSRNDLLFDAREGESNRLTIPMSINEVSITEVEPR